MRPFCAALLALFVNALLMGHAQAGGPIGTVTVHVTPGAPANTFVPNRALGAGVDGHEKGDIARIYTPANMAAMRSAGLRPLTYRLRTELGIEAWHWNPQGTWSDPDHQQGYWTSDAASDAPLTHGYGYRLPRRGSTIDQANNDGYSRLDDGDPNTFWKSNPYLDKHYTGEDNAHHPQWAVIDLGEPQRVNAIRLLWAVPYATQYAVEYWDGPNAISIDESSPGTWRVFPGGKVAQGNGGEVTLTLAQTPRLVRFVRVVMTHSSDTAPPGSHDLRDGLGYALREIYLGRRDRAGRLHDILRHGKTNKTQTVLYTSSTDPWHRAADRDDRIEQPGLDRVFRSGLTNDLPVLVPVPLLYDTPDNAAAEIAFLKARHYPIKAIEMGEEPDGQYVTPEDYGALYRQWADTLHRVDPALRLGGPCFQTTITDVAAWPDKRGNRSWMNRFLRTLREQNHAGDFNFFSFEWYPFDNVCRPTAPQLAQAPELLTGVLKRLQQEGLPRTIPWLITEYGYSSFAGRAEVDIEGALLNADIVGLFLTLGGTEAYLYGYEPNTLIKELECETWGNLTPFLSDDQRRIRFRLPTYYSAWLMTQQWALPASEQPHAVYVATSDIKNAKGQALVTAYATYRPDGQWALMLINKDPRRAQTVRVRFRNTRTRTIASLHGPVELYQYSSAQYVWKPNGEHGFPIRSFPPHHATLSAGGERPLTLPPYSLTVVRGRGPQER